MKRLFAVLAVLMLLLCGCGGSYSEITQEEAAQMMQDEPYCLIVDVRRPDEFAEGHIAGAINVPNEEIGEEMPAQLPDTEQVLLVYCRTGRRSKEASQKLADLGYTNVYEFGGINTWEGDIVTEETEDEVKQAYDMHMKIGDTEVEVKWEQNEAVDALAALNAGDWHEYPLSMYGGFEQVGALGSELPSDDVQTDTSAGDIVLYQSSQIVVFYGENSWAYTRLGHITDKTAQELRELLGNGDVTISIRADYK